MIQKQQEKKMEPELQCPRCKSSEGTFISLSCGHMLCILCTTYTYIKLKNEVKTEKQIKCMYCNRLSYLSSYQLELISQTIRDKLMPMITQQSQQKPQSKLIISKRNTSRVPRQRIQDTINKKIKSQQHSFQNAPYSAKYFFSKCESPNNKYQHNNNQYCSIHGMSEINSVCFTCNNDLLCVKCVASKQHKNHEIKGLKKGVEYISQQVSYGRLQAGQKIQCLEMWERRLINNKNLLSQKGEKSRYQIQTSFQQLFLKLENKKNQLLQACDLHYQNLTIQIDSEIGKIQQYLSQLRSYHDKLNYLLKVQTPQLFINQWRKIKKQVNISIVTALQPKLMEKLSYESTVMCQQIGQIAQCIKKMKIDYYPMRIVKHMPPENLKLLEKSKSDKKMRKEQNSKRIKTNFASLNSSRDRRQNKCAKTQEDDSKLKQKSMNKHQNNKLIRGQLPTYVKKYFQKNQTKGFLTGMSCLFDIHSQTGNSKTSSKIISKTVAPQQIEKKKKKDHSTNNKQRVQRKTTNLIHSTNKLDFPKRKKINN